MSPAGPVLVIDGDRRLALALTAELEQDGFQALVAHGHAAARRLAAASPAAVVLGLLETRPALALLGEIRAGGLWQERLPVIVLGAGNGLPEAVRALEAGADDFIARPVHYLELRARLRALLRRTAPHRPELIEAGPLRLDRRSREARLEDRPLRLTRTEFDLLALLAGDPERVFSRGELLHTVWGWQELTPTRTVDAHASRLRRKLHSASAGRWLSPARGIGYRLR